MRKLSIQLDRPKASSKGFKPCYLIVLLTLEKHLVRILDTWRPYFWDMPYVIYQYQNTVFFQLVKVL